MASKNLWNMHNFEFFIQILMNKFYFAQHLTGFGCFIGLDEVVT